jgi:hypothetical protein
MPMRSFRMSDELDARLEESRGGTPRSKWLLEAVEEKLSRSVGSRPMSPVAGMTRASTPERLAASRLEHPEVHTAHGAGVPDRADAFRAAAAKRQAALRQKP